MKASRFNQEIARQFREVADLLEGQHADPHRIRSYRRAASTLDDLEEPVDRIYAEGGVTALAGLPTIGRRLGHAIADVAETGRWRWLDRLRGEAAPEDLLASLPGIGTTLAARIHEQLHITTLEDLEVAAHDGRLGEVEGFGDQRVQGVIDAVAGRLQRRRHLDPSVSVAAPSVEELLDVDREYRELAESGRLPLIAPRRFNPTGSAWLPILHTSRGDRDYTVLYSNTALAHELGRIHDWVVVYDDGPGHGQWTVVDGPRQERVVRGR